MLCRFYEKVQALHQDPEASVDNPLLAFSLIKRLHSDWPNVIYSDEATENTQGMGGCMAVCPLCHLGRARRLLGLGGEAGEQVVEQENGWRNRRMGDGEEEWVMEQKNGWWNRRMGGRAEEWVKSRKMGGLSAC